MSLDPQCQAVIDHVVSQGRPPYSQLTPAQARQAFKESRGRMLPPASPVAATRALTIPGPAGGIAARLYRPLGSDSTAALPVLVYFHGGGWVLGDLDSHDPMCRDIANASACNLIAVDYRLAPENRFPAAVEDAIAATRWVAANAALLGSDPARVAVGGDSAGANLATVTALTLRDGGGPRLAAQILFYPAVDFAMEQPSHTDFASGYLLTRDSMSYFRDCYLNGPAEAADWRASPLKAASLAQLPPALIITAGFDPLRDEGKAYAERLQSSGATVEYSCHPGMIHGFLTMGGMVDNTARAISQTASFLRGAFG